MCCQEAEQTPQPDTISIIDIPLLHHFFYVLIEVDTLAISFRTLPYSLPPLVIHTSFALNSDPLPHISLCIIETQAWSIKESRVPAVRIVESEKSRYVQGTAH